MKNIYLALFLVFFTIPPTLAQNVNSSAQAVMEYNRTRPLQSPRYEKSYKTLARHIIDNKNNVVGDLQDIIIGQNGSVHSLKILFNRLNLDAPVYASFSALKIHPTPGAYVVGFQDDEIASLYPSLLAQVETAAGDAADNVSLSRIVGAEIYAADGRRIGTVQEALFDNEGTRIGALYVAMKTGVLNGQGLAIPFNQANFNQNNGAFSFQVSTDLANAMIDYASKSL